VPGLPDGIEVYRSTPPGRLERDRHQDRIRRWGVHVRRRRPQRQAHDSRRRSDAHPGMVASRRDGGCVRETDWASGVIAGAGRMRPPSRISAGRGFFIENNYSKIVLTRTDLTLIISIDPQPLSLFRRQWFSLQVGLAHKSTSSRRLMEPWADKARNGVKQPLFYVLQSSRLSINQSQSRMFVDKIHIEGRWRFLLRLATTKGRTVVSLILRGFLSDPSLRFTRFDEIPPLLMHNPSYCGRLFRKAPRRRRTPLWLPPSRPTSPT